MRNSIKVFYFFLFAAGFFHGSAVAQQFQSAYSEAEAPLFLQLNKNYFLAGDTVFYALKTSAGRNAWYLFEIYKGSGVEKVKTLTGRLENSHSTGKLALPEKLEEGVYWARILLDEHANELILPFYIFSQPKDIKPEARYSFQLALETPAEYQAPSGKTNFSYRLWPVPLLSGGRLIVMDKSGEILADTLLTNSGRGKVQIQSQGLPTYRAEVWLNELRIAEAKVPEPQAVSLEAFISDTSLTVIYSSADSLQGNELLISGPEGLSYQKSLDSKKGLTVSHTSWPPGKYTVTLLSQGVAVSTKRVWLGRKQPELELPEKRLGVKGRYFLNARLEGVLATPEVSWQLRVISAAQEGWIFKDAISDGKETGPLTACRIGETLFFLRQKQEGGKIDPSLIEGIVMDSHKKPVSDAFLLLLGKDLDRPYYLISDQKGQFKFNNLPLPGKEKYLLAFPSQESGILNTSVFSTAAPPGFPEMEIDSSAFRMAKAYAEKHFLLQLVGKEEPKEEKKASAAANSLALYVPAEWINTYKPADYVDFPNLSEFIQEAIPGLRLRYEDGRSYMRVLNIINSQTKVYHKGDPLYLLNGYPLLNADSLLSIAPTLVDSVQLVRNSATSYYGRVATFGVLALYTKKHTGNLLFPTGGKWLKPSSVINKFTWTSRGHPFQEEKRNLPWVSGLIKWKDKLEVQPDGSFSFDLQTSDEPGDFFVEVTGFYPDGKIVSLRESLYINPPKLP